MDTLLELIADLSRWSRGNLHGISLALLATLLVLFGPAVNRWLRLRSGRLNVVLRTLLFGLVCVGGYGLAMVWLPAWIARGLDQFDNHTLGPLLLLVWVLLGAIAQRD